MEKLTNEELFNLIKHLLEKQKYLKEYEEMAENNIKELFQNSIKINNKKLLEAKEELLERMKKWEKILA